jgi:hypothetical protein
LKTDEPVTIDKVKDLEVAAELKELHVAGRGADSQPPIPYIGQDNRKKGTAESSS